MNKGWIQIICSVFSKTTVAGTQVCNATINPSAVPLTQHWRGVTLYCLTNVWLVLFIQGSLGPTELFFLPPASQLLHSRAEIIVSRILTGNSTQEARAGMSQVMVCSLAVGRMWQPRQRGKMLAAVFPFQRHV